MMTPSNYRLIHKRSGCYEVLLVSKWDSAPFVRFEYLTNFTKKNDALEFIEDHRAGRVTTGGGS